MLILFQRIHLNHQNPDEYVLIFRDGRTCICLHEGFNELFKKLVLKAFSRIEWDFQPSCSCDEAKQNQINAKYYRCRGLFQLRRGHQELALEYLRVAVELGGIDDYWDDFGMAFIAAQKVRKNLALEGFLRMGSAEAFNRLSARLQRVELLGPCPDWSYSIGRCQYELLPEKEDSMYVSSTTEAVELAVADTMPKTKTLPPELESQQRSPTLPSYETARISHTTPLPGYSVLSTTDGSPAEKKKSWDFRIIGRALLGGEMKEIATNT